MRAFAGEPEEWPRLAKRGDDEWAQRSQWVQMHRLKTDVCAGRRPIDRERSTGRRGARPVRKIAADGRKQGDRMQLARGETGSRLPVSPGRPWEDKSYVCFFSFRLSLKSGVGDLLWATVFAVGCALRAKKIPLWPGAGRVLLPRSAVGRQVGARVNAGPGSTRARRRIASGAQAEQAHWPSFSWRLRARGSALVRLAGVEEV